MSTLTDFRQERRADDDARTDRQIKQQAAQREQDRIDARERFERQQEAADRETERKRQEKEARRKAKADKRRAAKTRRTERRRALAARVTWARNNGDVTLTLLVMACGMIPALISQHAVLDGMGMGPLLSLMLPVMLELAAWAATAGEARALAEKRSARPYRIGVWTAATVAATVNALHAWAEFAGLYRVIGVVVLAASSLGPVWLWHRVMAGRHAPTEAEVKEAAARAEHAKRRRADHPEVSRLADTLVSAAPFGTLAEEDAFVKAWALVHGDVPGMTADLRASEVQARVRIAAACRETPDAVHGRILAALTGPAPKTGDKPAKTRKPRRTNSKESQVSSSNPPSPVRGRGRKRGPQVDAARRSASETAKASDPAVKAAAVDWIAERLRTGEGVHWKDDVQPHFPYSRAWIYARIGDAQKRVDGEKAPALRAVGGAS